MTSMQIKMLPTPAKFHYIFNLRDLSRIWEGLLLVAAAECESTGQVLALWLHECNRVIADRFTNAQVLACGWYCYIVCNMMLCLQDVEWFLGAVDVVRREELDGTALACPEPYFVDFLRDPPEPTGEEPEDADLEAPKIYELVSRRNLPLCMQ